MRTKLYYGRKKVAEVIPDSRYPSMWRVSIGGALVSDMANIDRAKDAAMALVRHYKIVESGTPPCHWE